MDRGIAQLMDPETASLRSAEREIRQAQAQQIQQILTYVSRVENRSAVEDGSSHLTSAPLPPGAPDAPAEARRAAVLHATQALQASEHYVGELVAASSQALERLPRTWDSFCQGRIGVQHLLRMARSSLALLSSENVALLDQRGCAYAEEHTPGQLAAWLRRFIAAREPEAAARRNQEALRERRVSVTHLEDGVSLLTALLPTVTAEQIRRRLSAVARSPQQAIPHDPSVVPETAGAEDPSSAGPDLPASRGAGDTRTLEQRTADLLAGWLLSGRRAQERPADVRVGLLVPLETLSGDAEAPALSRDRSFTLPAPVVRRLLGHSGTRVTWYELGVRNAEALGSDTQDPDVLSVRYRRRFVPKLLREAIRFRDGTCQAPGCHVPAENCDIDHQRPWRDSGRDGPGRDGAGGQTEGQNLWTLCRRHHLLKTAGHLPTPTDRSAAPATDRPSAMPTAVRAAA